MGKPRVNAIILSTVVSANLAGGTLLGIFVGMWLDKITGAKPIFTIICLLIGLTIGVIGMITSVKKSEE
ncbi:AtpZ/AtpI family protein [Ornithinibacillus halophilus]|uniref:ATP synthase protein I n=1 Tax=Ornithinibacillus halophilus TaxID=930117 RepID=A0A1M5LVE2_9BACI|nr:AtpZ/AtpI family protein [Ornithinibacillus halophilus]SHG68966.1 ATP synthase protein I [Ornithinibacillus halophilus]